jgi:hypothetical protein
MEVTENKIATIADLVTALPEANEHEGSAFLTMSVADQDFPVVMNIIDDDLVISCELCTLSDLGWGNVNIDDLQPESMPKLAEMLSFFYGASVLNNAAAPFAIAVLDLDEDFTTIEPDNSVVLKDSMTIGDLSESEVEVAMDDLRTALVTVLPLVTGFKNKVD